MRKLLATIGVSVAGLTGPAVGVGLAQAASAAPAKPQCVTRVHYNVVTGRSGHITDWVTCGGGNYVFRAEAECFRNGGGGSGTFRFGSWRSANDSDSTAGCLSGTYIESGGYQVGGSNKYHVLWRYAGQPLSRTS